MAAVYGLLTMEAIVFRYYPGQDYVDGCFHSAAVQMSYDRHAVDMSGLFKLVNEYGANVDRSGALARCVDRNAFVVSALVQLGADRAMLSWAGGGTGLTLLFIAWLSVGSWVCLRLWFANLSPEDLDLGDEHGCTALMTLLRLLRKFMLVNVSPGW